MRDFLSDLRKEYQPDIAMLCQKKERKKRRLPSGYPALDRILGGGWPAGEISEIYGAENSGKTTVALQSIAAAQKKGKQCAYIDAEHAFSLRQAETLGVDCEKLLFAAPTAGEDALGIIGSLIRSGTVDLIVVDSVAALVPMEELEQKIGEAGIDLHTKLINQAMKQLAAPARAMNCTLIFLNQIRARLHKRAGGRETTPGGKALKYYASVRLRLQRKQEKRGGAWCPASVIIAKTTKNTTFPPEKTTAIELVADR